MTTASAPTATSGPLVLADMSGYTAFLQDVALAHRDDAFADGQVPEAYGILTRLLDGIVGKLVPPYTLSKLEGDAVFAFATQHDDVPRGGDVLVGLQACYADFRQRVGSAQEIWPCWCDACANIEQLDLKFVLHSGPFVLQEIAGQRELIGSEVVIAHRLLKATAPELAGRSAFALVTGAAAEHLEVPLDDCIRVVESHEHYAPIEAHVFALDA
ncbi:MAG TPA: DUF2652 domain-containing protein [Gaiellaceae bacterium]|jgi:hypothetical protein|nr:DUF2652 domain-containing protein [Gaiellaceae bacterium]